MSQYFFSDENNHFGKMFAKIGALSYNGSDNSRVLQYQATSQKRQIEEML